MKKILLILSFIISSQIGGYVNFVFAETDRQKIEQTVKNFIKAEEDEDLDLIMNQISKNFSKRVIVKGLEKMIHYDNYRAFVEERFNSLKDISVANLKITKLEIKDNTADVIMEYDFDALMAQTGSHEKIKTKRGASLVKEGDSWKIMDVWVFDFVPPFSGEAPSAGPG
ncbi:MAG: hypothetical protein PHE18_08000 [Candidatus Omnitrophica bacterium]|nr:hypothetical protein [Candidatus Omnitrophota bacterium]MDD5553795.1 hypothetical protein [Candidatus Omnitrophota bacterium]